MTYRGHIKNGVAVLDGGVKLPEGAEVRVEPVAAAAGDQQPVEATTSLGELFRDVAGQGTDLPADGSLQHDHYIYGTAKR